MTKEMKVREGIEYHIGEFDCPVCKKHVDIYCFQGKKKVRHRCKP